MNRRPVSDHPPLSYHRHYEFMFHCPFNQMNYLSPSADPLDSAEPRRLFFASSLPRNLTEQITECATSAHSRATPRTKWRSLVKATSFLNLLFSLSLSLSLALSSYPLRSIIYGRSPLSLFGPAYPFAFSLMFSRFCLKFDFHQTKAALSH